MFKKIKIENFRGIKHLEFNDTKQFNLIVGKNNSCKTTVLEGIYLLIAPTNPSNYLKINTFRNFRLIDEHSWPLIFNKMDTQMPLTLYGEVARPEEKRYLTIKPLSETVLQKPGETLENITSESSQAARVVRMNGLSFEYSIKKKNRKKPLKLNSDIRTNGKELNMNQSDSYNNPLNGIFVFANYNFGDNARRFAGVKRKKQEEKVIKILQKMEPGICDL
ncbi:MAG: AAA family ATPase [Candidatus Aminicenantes bacterium]|nr:AAA family ATPase [Candidatus Aminicenantes bacterium]